MPGQSSGGGFRYPFILYPSASFALAIGPAFHSPSWQAGGIGAPAEVRVAKSSVTGFDQSFAFAKRPGAPFGKVCCSAFRVRVRCAAYCIGQLRHRFGGAVLTRVPGEGSLPAPRTSRPLLSTSSLPVRRRSGSGGRSFVADGLASQGSCAPTAGRVEGFRASQMGLRVAVRNPNLLDNIVP